ncbi:MAG: type II secretion system F family protein [Natrialbaceae archaeon]
MIQLLAGVLTLLLCVLVSLPLVSDRAAVVVDGVGMALFGGLASDGARRRRREETLEAAHVDQSYDVFAPQTVLYALCFGAIVGFASVATVPPVLTVLGTAEGTTLGSVLPAAVLAVDWLAPSTVVLVTGGVTVLLGAGVAVAAHELRWFVLGERAKARATRIEATLPRTVAFMYALSRSGMAFPQILRILSNHGGVYGEAATELSSTVRDIDVFGTDVVTALERTSDRTPSENMEELADNLASVLASGQNLPSYLESQYERFKEEAEAQQEQYLDLLATFAEVYVTVLVVGPLFLITILAVVGLVIQDTITAMRLMVFLGIPLVTALFVIYVDSMMTSLQTPQTGETEAADARRSEHAAAVTDGGYRDTKWAEQAEALVVYDKLERLLSSLREPVQTVLANPWLTMLFTVPLGLLWVGLTVRENYAGVIGSYFARAGAGVAAYLNNPSLAAAEELLFAGIEAIDTTVVEALIVICFVYAIVYEIDQRRTRKVEVEIPDFLDRFGSINRAGMSAIEAFRRVANTDLGKLSPELKRTLRDIQWGSEVEMALERMDRRVRSPLVTRAVTLVTNALRTSGDIAPVLSIAADEARSSQQLNRDRKQAMVTYLIVIYIAFLVFLGIIVVLAVSFIPAIESAAEQAASTGQVSGSTPGVGGGLGQFEEVDIDAYESLFFHMTAIQAICSGLVGGQLGAGGLRDGVKHTAILLLLTYIVFSFI